MPDALILAVRGRPGAAFDGLALLVREAQLPGLAQKVATSHPPAAECQTAECEDQADHNPNPVPRSGHGLPQVGGQGKAADRLGQLERRGEHVHQEGRGRQRGDHGGGGRWVDEPTHGEANPGQADRVDAEGECRGDGDGNVVAGGRRADPRSPSR